MCKREAIIDGSNASVDYLTVSVLEHAQQFGFHPLTNGYREDMDKIIESRSIDGLEYVNDQGDLFDMAINFLNSQIEDSELFYVEDSTLFLESTCENVLMCDNATCECC